MKLKSAYCVLGNEFQSHLGVDDIESMLRHIFGGEYFTSLVGLRGLLFLDLRTFQDPFMNLSAPNICVVLQWIRICGRIEQRCRGSQIRCRTRRGQFRIVVWIISGILLFFWTSPRKRQGIMENLRYPCRHGGLRERNLGA